MNPVEQEYTLREFGPVEHARFEQLVLPYIDAAFNPAY